MKPHLLLVACLFVVTPSIAQKGVNARRKTQRNVPVLIAKPEYNPITQKDVFLLEGTIVDSLTAEPLTDAIV
ncbi:MAG: hypothetical protein NZ108_06160, partial [Bacteroidia bacterium]|nr:hypothetical protein [Bacteroidia bacterium]